METNTSFLRWFKRFLLLIFPLFMYHVSISQCDTTNLNFGIQGKASYSLAPLTDYITSMAMLPDGKIIATGNISTVGDNTLLMRMLPNGDMDSTFGTNGFTITDIIAMESDEGSHILPLSSGNIIVFASVGIPFGDLYMLKYLPNGSLDNSFGTQGHLMLGGMFAPVISDVHFDSNGKIILAGSEGFFNLRHQMIMKVDTNGVIDNTFGTNGKTVLTQLYDSEIGSIYVDENDGIIAVGDMAAVPSFWQTTLTKFFPNGLLDTTWANEGVSMMAFANPNFGRVLEVDSAGYCYISYTFQASAHDIELARIKPDGSLDSTFGINGRVTTDINNQGDFITNLLLQADGSFYAIGGSSPLTAPGSGIIIQKYTHSGMLDPSFSSDGTLQVAYTDDEVPSSRALVVKDNLLYIGGYTTIGDFQYRNVFVVSICIDDLVHTISSDEIKSPFKLYPNPTTDILYIACENNRSFFSITDIIGGIIVPQTPLSNNIPYELPTNSWAKGIYFLQMQDEKGTVYTEKFVKD